MVNYSQQVHLVSVVLVDVTPGVCVSVYVWAYFFGNTVQAASVSIAADALQDRRKDLSKKVSKMGEDGKISVRNVRKDAIKKLDKYDFPKDTKKGLEDSIQKLTDSYVKKLDDMVTAKTDDIMKV